LAVNAGARRGAAAATAAAAADEVEDFDGSWDDEEG